MAKKSYNSKYDAKDLQILYLLNQNARLTPKQIGKLVRLSREVVDYRIKKLIKTNAITSFNTVISLARLGFQSYTLLLQLERTSLADETRLMNFLTSHKLVRYLTRCRGNWDMTVSFVCKNRMQLSLFIDKLRSFSNLLGNEFLLIPIKPVKFDDIWFLSHVEYDYAEPKIILQPKVDEIDQKILTIIATNAKISLRKLAKIIGLSVDATYKRFKKLMSMGLIRRFKANLNTEVFGLQEYELYLKIDNYSQKEELILRNFFKDQKHVVRASRIVGNYDITLTIICKDLDEFEFELERIRKFFGKRIKNYMFSLVFKEFKRTSCPDGIFEKEPDLTN